jgi:hypothetical protein
LKHYKYTVVLPPKIYHYEQKVFGFKIVGKEGVNFLSLNKEILSIILIQWLELIEKSW